MKDIFSIFQNHKKWYSLPLTNMPFITSKQSIVNKLLEIEKDKYNGECILNHNGYELTLTINGFGKDLKATIKSINIGEYGGFYDHKNEISLNIKFCKINKEPEDYNTYNREFDGGGKGIYEYLTHELHHAFQIYLINNQNEILQQLDDKDKRAFKTYIEQLNACMSINNKQLNYMNFKHECNLSIKPYMPLSKDRSELKDISQMFYFLNISEYEAFNICANSLNNLNNQNGLFDFTNPDNEDMMVGFSKEIENAFHMFMDRYRVHYDNIEDVVNIISNCMLKLYNHKQPDTTLEASVMYDICCITQLQEINISSEENKDRENIEKICMDLLQKETKEKALEQYYNIHPLKDDIKIYKESEFCMIAADSDFIQKLSQEECKYNPKLILYFASFNSCNNIDYSLYATNELKDYCQTEIQSLYNNPIYKDGAKVIFGENFWRELGMEGKYIEQEGAEYNDYIEEQENQYNSTNISSYNTLSQDYQDFNDDEPDL